MAMINSIMLLAHHMELCKIWIEANISYERSVLYGFDHRIRITKYMERLHMHHY